MARRNLFQPPAPPVVDTDPKEPRVRFPNTGAMSGVKSTLKDLSSNAVRDIPVEMIEEGGPKDRLAFTDADVAQLADSIRQHGQQVPIMVRPLADRPGHYQIVYGRRRLRALRALGIAAKALVRSLSDQEAILAQGQENAQRLDPSFVEKALFAAELLDSGYDQPVILDALAIDKPMLSRMTKVARAIPAAVIHAIGSAHGVGRRRWEELADLTREGDLDLTEITAALQLDAIAVSDDRFAKVSAAAAQWRSKPVDRPAQMITLQDGTPLAELRDSPRALTLRLSKSDSPGFVRWLQQNAETELQRLYQTWRADQRSE